MKQALYSASEGKFCYMIIKDSVQMIAGFVLMVVCLGLIAFGIRNYIKIKRINMSKHVVRIYMLIFCWGVFYLVKIVYSMIIFAIMDHYESQSWQISVMTKYYFIIDLATVYILQAAIITLPINWMENIVGIIKQLASFQNSEQEPAIENLNFQLVTIKLLRYYQWIRLVIVVPTILLLLQDQYSYQQIVAYICACFLLIEMLFVILILGLGLRSLYSNNKLSELIDQGDMKLMANQYRILIICTILRLVIDATFIFVFNLGLLDDGHAPIQCPKKDFNQALNLLTMFGEGFFTHFLPVFIIYRIYSVSDSEIVPSDSLLAVQPYKSESSQIHDND